MLREFRCSKCNKLLGKIEGRAEIVCTRCKVLNAFNVPDELRKAMNEQDDQSYEVFRREYLGRWVNVNKSVEDSKSCSECEHLQNDDEVLRCQLFDGAIIENAKDKNCIDSAL